MNISLFQKEGEAIATAIQVTYTMPNEKARKREIGGLLDAMTAYNLQSGLIITDDHEEEIIENSKTIKIIPAWKWLLE